MEIYYSPKYISSEYGFDTTRKSGIVANLIRERFQPDEIQIVDPKKFKSKTEALIKEVHDPKYVNAVKTGKPRQLAESQGFTWDKNIYHMAVAHSAGIVAAVHAASNGKISGSLSSGLHHARRNSGSGFCTFNGLAVGIKEALSLGFTNIAVIDFDAHPGDGTYSLMKGKMTQVDVTVSGYIPYGVSESDHNSIFISVGNQDSYLGSIERALNHVADEEFDLIIYNAGMDPYNAGISVEELAEREVMVSEWITEQQSPALFTLAGGYSWGKATRDEIAELHMMTVGAFANIRVGV